jgi:hypothetical protein
MITRFYLVRFKNVREAADFAVKLLVGKSALFAKFTFPKQRRLVLPRRSQMAVKAVF